MAKNEKPSLETRTAGAAVPPRLATSRVAHLSCRDNGRRPDWLGGDTGRTIGTLGFHRSELARSIGSAGVFPSLPFHFSTSQPTTPV